MRIVTIATKGQGHARTGYIPIVGDNEKSRSGVPERLRVIVLNGGVEDQSFLKIPLTSSTTLSTVFETLSSASSTLSPTRLPISSALAFSDG